MNLKTLSLLIFTTLNFTYSAHSQTVTSTKTETESKAKLVGASYANYMNGPTLAKNNGQYSVNHYFSTKLELRPTWSVDFVLRPDQNLGQIPEGEKSLEMADPYLKFESPSIYKTETASINLQPRYYASLSNSSKEKGLDGKAVLRLYANKKIGKVNLLYILIPTYHFYKKELENQVVFSHGHWLQSSYDISSKWALDFAYFPTWNSERGEKQVFEASLAYPGATYNATDNLSLSTYFETVANKVESKTTRLGGSVTYKML